MQRKVMGAALAAVLIAVSVLTLSPASSGAATNPQEGEHDVARQHQPGGHHAHVLDGNTQAVVDLGSRVIVGGKFTQVKRYNQPTVFTRDQHLRLRQGHRGDRHHLRARSSTARSPRCCWRPTARCSSPASSRRSTALPGPLPREARPGHRRARTRASRRSRTGWSTTSTSTAARSTSAAPSPSSATSSAPTSAWSSAVHRRTDRRARRRPSPSAATGFTRIMRLDVSPDGTSLVAIGNFTQVGGQYRPNIAKLDVTGDHGHGELVVHRRLPLRPLLVQLRHLHPRRRLLAGRQLLRRRHHRRLLRLRPASATPPAAGRPTAPAPSPPRGSTTPVATPSARSPITGAAVYVAGHQRWANNAIPSGGDRKGPGAVDRVGIAALDAESGVPLSWNPGRERGITGLAHGAHRRRASTS